SVRLAKIVAGGKRMRSVDACAQREFRTRLHNRAQVFEAMTDALALARSVLQQEAQPSELQTFAGQLKTQRADFDGVFFTGTTRTARMQDEVINPEQNGAFDFYPKRSDRLEQYRLISRGQIDQIVGVNQDGSEFGLLARLAEERDRFIRKRLGHPTARIARENLDGVAAGFFGDNEGFMQAAFDRGMKTYPGPCQFTHWFIEEVSTESGSDRVRLRARLCSRQ